MINYSNFFNFSCNFLHIALYIVHIYAFIQKFLYILKYKSVARG